MSFVGPAYTLGTRSHGTRKASFQDSVNLFLAKMETEAKAQFILQSIPGLELKSTSGAVTRQVICADDRLFAVMGGTLYEIDDAGVQTSMGSLDTASGFVSMDYGISQLVIVDGRKGYTLTLSTDTFATITDADWPDAETIGYLNGFFILSNRDGQQFNTTSIDDASTLDALDFASSESSSDNICTHLVSNSELLLLGDLTTERWYASGAADFPFSRDNAANSEIGCAAIGSAKRIDNSFFWLGRDRNGIGYIFRDVDRQPQRISTIAVEESLQGSTDLSGAVAYVYQMDGHSFYCLNAPGLSETWCYCLNTQSWFKACDLDGNGNFTAYRVTHTCFAHGKQWAFDADGNVYEMRSDLNTIDGDPLKRTRISVNAVTPMRDRQFFSEFALDCTTGEAASGVSPIVELSYSDDGGYTWSDPIQESAGEIGEYFPRVVWNRLGSARDRVWRVDFSDDAPFAIIDANAR